ncbi:single-stranded-DNA-specific exonuclease RecJ [Microgenomates group bacterium]|nr:single-stranded-DNA-specific exonuclease RecJ [Microgenomates group bacterium]
MQWEVINKKTPRDLAEMRKVWLENRELILPERQKEFFEREEMGKISCEEIGLEREEIEKVRVRLLRARERKERVLIYGDYDVDGNCATAITWLSLKKWGLETIPFIPERKKHGYGLTMKSMKKIDELMEKGEKPDLIVTVDNGIVAFEAAEELKKRAIDLIITDHHKKDEKKGSPEAVAVVVSSKVCGAGVAWFLWREIIEKEQAMAEMLDLLGVATVADQMEVLGINRQLIKNGLYCLQTKARLGIKKLAEQAGMDLTKITKEGIDYGLGPRLNALGRLEGGLDTLRLLCTGNEKQAERLAGKIEAVNQRRREMTEQMWKEAEEQAREQMKQKRKVLIVESKEWHEGIVGLLASRLVETFSRPALVMCVDEETTVVSARSLGSIDITRLMRKAEKCMLSVGGHLLAGGGVMENTNREAFRKQIWEAAEKEITSEDLEAKLIIESEVPSSLLTDELVELLEDFAPFGQGNSEPLVMIKKMQLLAIDIIGKEENHWRTWWWDKKSQARIKIMAWQAEGKWEKGKWEEGGEYEIVIRPSINEWQDRKTLQLELVEGREVC